MNETPLTEKPKKKYKKMYLDKHAFHDALVQWKRLRDVDPKTPMPEYIGECILKLVKNAATRRNFSGYHFLDLMETEALYLCVRYGHKYDPDNPKVDAYNYFSKIIERAFIHIINQEKKRAKRQFEHINAICGGKLDYDYRVLDNEED